jgi:dTDP-4-amino-4,6-dideoxygalactose transaminase
LLPNAEYASDRVISLPFYPRMKEEDIFDVIEVVKKIIKSARK